MGNWNNPAFNCATCQAQGWIKSRNCSKFDPDNMNKTDRTQFAINANNPWWPSYSDRKNNPFTVGEVSSEECPVACITETSQQLIQIDAKQRLAKDACGASLYGDDLSKWPSRIVDALTTIQGQINLTENTRQEIEF
jgi:hypothetical protein